MTPQEISEYKAKWKNNAWSWYIDPDADIFAKDWCRRNLEKKDWSFESHARPDDWHKIMFREHHMLHLFQGHYRLNFK